MPPHQQAPEALILSDAPDERLRVTLKINHRRIRESESPQYNFFKGEQHAIKGNGPRGANAPIPTLEREHE